MPYIDPDDRPKVSVITGTEPAVRAGDLNFQITELVDDYVRRQGVCYDTYNEVIGVLECCKLEYYRRRCAPYEDKKCRINGDVFT